MKLLAVFALCLSTAPAQILYDYLSRDVAGDILRKNDINSNLMLGRMQVDILAQQLQLGRINLLRMRGQLRLQEGRGSTAYQHSPDASLATSAEPANRAAVGQVLDSFNAALAARGLRRHNVADCHALGVVLSYYGYRGEDPGPRRLAKLREQTYSALMEDLAFQGFNEAERQNYCERVAFLSMLAAGARNEASRAAPGAGQDAMIAKAQLVASSAAKDIFAIPMGSAELTPDGFGDRAARQAKDGSGSVTFRRTGTSQRVATFDRFRGSGAGGKLIENFNAAVRQYGGSDTELPDTWATGFAALIHVRERGNVTVSGTGWRAARDYMKKWALAQPVWLRKSDAERQELADGMALDVADLVERFELNRRQMATPPRRDPITGVVFQTRVDERASLSQKAEQLIIQLFVPEERATIEGLLRR